jgi:hypothetical protein
MPAAGRSASSGCGAGSCSFGVLAFWAFSSFEIFGDFAVLPWFSSSLRLLPERHAHLLQQRQPFGVGPRPWW